MSTDTGGAAAISKKAAMEFCETCPDKDKPMVCDFGHIEWYKSNDIIPPACLIARLKNKPSIYSEIVEKRKKTEKVENSTISQKDSTFPLKKSGKSGNLVEENKTNLSRTAQRFLTHIKDGITKIKSIQCIENCGDSNLYKYLGELRSQGFINYKNGIVEIYGGTHPGGGGEDVHEQRTTKQKTEQLHAEGGAPYQRVHSHQFVVDILWKDHNYERIRKEGDEYHDDDGNRVKLNEKNVEIYAPKDKSWDAPTVDEAIDTSMDYFEWVVIQIQNRNKIILIKNRVSSIHLRKVHAGFVGHPAAEDVIVRGERFRIYHRDGKLRMIIDASHGHPEMETLSNTAVPDMREVERHYQDILENKPPTNSELQANLIETNKSLKEAAAGINNLVMLAQPKKEEQVMVEKRNWYDLVMYG